MPGYAGHITWVSCVAGPPNVSATAPLSADCFAIACRAMDDMVILAHIRDQHRLSLQSYGRPRMNRTIKDATVKRFHYDNHDQLRTHLTELHGCLQLRPQTQDPQRSHALRIHLQALDVRARSIHHQPDPPDAGTEHLGAVKVDVCIPFSYQIAGAALDIGRVIGQCAERFLECAKEPFARIVQCFWNKISSCGVLSEKSTTSPPSSPIGLGQIDG